MFFKDTRRRNILLVTITLLLIIVILGGMRFLSQMNDKRFSAETQLESIQDISSIPGGSGKPVSQEYVRLQKQQNKQQAQEAKKTGRSAIATIVDSFQTEQQAKNEMSDSPEIASAQSMKDIPEQAARMDVFPPDQSFEERAVLARQNALLSDQKAEVLKQQMQAAMHQQMGQLFGVWNNASSQQAVIGLTEGTQNTNKPSATQLPKANETTLIKAGTILHAILLTAINSDEPGPILAKVVAGEFQGARLIGTLSNFGERVLIQFNTLHLPAAQRPFRINAVAVDEGTARTALSSHTDRHLVLRYGSLFAASLLELYGLSFQRAGMYMQGNLMDNVYGEIRSRESIRNNASNAEGNPSQGSYWHPAFDPKGKVFIALGNVGSQFSSVLANQFHKAPTVHVNAGTGIGVLLTTDLIAPDQPNTE